ncbi:DotA/TraY family protein [Symbiopectobacterium purcellii]|uniref:DotA/TraY family protein n=1 Tax=Symbiopectobacterium purcellii TaxID=2871826 RepID=A0ABX9ASD8_9ENTR|nr:DotA/TraY family protein [Symbiopectobacterium purcellii]QZN96705.1 DotA/TraY family protein [Symbiopectobacterium purcellii]
MNIKKFGKVVSAPVWIPLLPVIFTFKRLYRTHNNQREFIAQQWADIREKLNAKKADSISEPLSFEEAVRLAEANAAARGECYSLEETLSFFCMKKRMILVLVYMTFVTGLITMLSASILYGFMMIITSCVMTLFAVPAQFRIWQIKTRRLSREERGGFDDFKRETRWFLDTLKLTNSPTVGKTLLTALLAITLATPFISHAQSLEDITSAADRGTDLSRQAMVSLFGQIVNDPLNGITEDGGETHVAQILKIFSTTLLIVGTAVGGYLITQKTAQTAHDGVFLDRERGSFWMPIRVLAAFSMLTPWPNGWTLSALLMLYAASKVGVGGANYATDRTVDAFMVGQSFVLQPVAPSTQSLARSLFESNLCMFGINTSLDQQASSGGIVFPDDYVNQSPLENGFILKSKSYTCGGATIAIEKESSVLSTLGIVAEVDVSAIKDAHVEGLNEMQRTLRSGAQQFVEEVMNRQQEENAPLVNAEAIVQNASQVYENRVTAAIRSSNVNSQLQNLTSQVADTIKSEGWFSLGSWYQTLAVANNRIGNSAAAKGSAFGQSMGQIPVTTDAYKLVMSAYQAQKSVTDNTSAGVLTAKSSFETNEIKDPSSFFGYVFSAMGQDITRQLISMSENDSNMVNPIIAMKNLGDRLIVGAEIGFVTYGAAKAISSGLNESLLGWVSNKFVGASAAIKAIVDFSGPYVTILLVMLIGSGITLSIYIPLMPYIIWVSACVNYLIIIGEGIFASALWAFSHLLGTGDGMGQKTAHGYIFLLNLMFRPILMVGGFLLGGGIVIIAGTLITKLLPSAIANAQFDSISGIVTITGFIIIYCSMSIAMVHTSFSLINIVPDQVINWVGGHMASSLGRDTSDKASHATNILANKTENTLNGKKGEKEKTPPNNSLK